MKLPLTQDEKIDYIYNQMRNQKRYAIFKVIFKVIVIIFIVVSILNIYQSLDKENMIESLQDKFSEFTYPIIENLLEKTNDDLQQKYQQQLQQW